MAVSTLRVGVWCSAMSVRGNTSMCVMEGLPSERGSSRTKLPAIVVSRHHVTVERVGDGDCLFGVFCVAGACLCFVYVTGEYGSGNVAQLLRRWECSLICEATHVGAMWALAVTSHDERSGGVRRAVGWSSSDVGGM